MYQGRIMINAGMIAPLMRPMMFVDDAAPFRFLDGDGEAEGGGAELVRKGYLFKQSERKSNGIKSPWRYRW